jgi:hypothetical protein
MGLQWDFLKETNLVYRRGILTESGGDVECLYYKHVAPNGAFNLLQMGS